MGVPVFSLSAYSIPPCRSPYAHAQQRRREAVRIETLFESALVRHWAPTLAGWKAGSLFRARGQRAETRRTVCRWNQRLAAAGVTLRILREEPDGALVFVFRREGLERVLSAPESRRFLAERGYGGGGADTLLEELSRRLAGGEFPHELGLFLGYPLSDVVGFILNRGQNCKCTGCWKVYSNEAETCRRFAQFKRCQQIYAYQFQNGRTLSQLTVSGVPRS